MKKRLLALVGILVCVVIAVSLFESDANSQAGTKWTVIGRLVRGLDSARFDGPVIINGTLTHNGNLTGVDKLVIDDSLRVGKTSIFNGAMTLNGNLTGVDKAVLDDSLRVGKTSIFNGAVTLNGDLTGVDKVVADDSLRVGKTSIFNGAMTINSTITLPGSGALKIDSVFYSASNDTLLIAVATKGTFYLVLRP